MGKALWAKRVTDGGVAGLLWHSLDQARLQGWFLHTRSALAACCQHCGLLPVRRCPGRLLC